VYTLCKLYHRTRLKKEDMYIQFVQKKNLTKNKMVHTLTLVNNILVLWLYFFINAGEMLTLQYWIVKLEKSVYIFTHTELLYIYFIGTVRWYTVLYTGIQYTNLCIRNTQQLL
jgi:hypothetical protein